MTGYHAAVAMAPAQADRRNRAPGIAWLAPAVVAAAILLFAYADWDTAVAWLSAVVAIGDVLLWRMGDDMAAQPRRRTRWLIAILMPAVLYLVEPTLIHRPALWVAVVGAVLVPMTAFIKFGRPSTHHSMAGRIALLIWLLAAALHLAWHLDDALVIGAAALLVYAIEGTVIVLASAEPPTDVTSVVHQWRQRKRAGWPSSAPTNASDQRAGRR